MQCHASHQTAEIMKIMGLLVVHVPSRWRPDHGRDGGRCRGPRTHPVAEKRSKQQRFSPSEVLLGVLGCISMPFRHPLVHGKRHRRHRTTRSVDAKSTPTS